MSESSIHRNYSPFELNTGIPRERWLYSKQRGVVVIEFILVLPLLLFMVGYTLRLTQLLQANQIAMTFSREVATEAFRRCTDMTILATQCLGEQEMCIDQEVSTAVTSTCLQQIKQKYETLWPVARPSGNSDNAVVDLAIYRYDFESFRIPENCSTAPRKFTAIHTSNDLETPPISNESLCLRNRVARARISFAVSPTAAFLTLIPGVIKSNFSVIDETVL